jgi:hemoglobin
MIMKRSIFERYGGFAQVSRVVTAFYDKMLDSPVTAPYFAEIDMRRMIDHQTRFIASIMGGPASYTNDHLERVHARHNISETAFGETVTLLRETLEELNYEDEDIHAIVDQVMACKNFVVGRSEQHVGVH